MAHEFRWWRQRRLRWHQAIRYKPEHVRFLNRTFCSSVFFCFFLGLKRNWVKQKSRINIKRCAATEKSLGFKQQTQQHRTYDQGSKKKNGTLHIYAEWMNERGERREPKKIIFTITVATTNNNDCGKNGKKKQRICDESQRQDWAFRARFNRCKEQKAILDKNHESY